MAKNLILMGLVQPKSDDLVEAFNEWYLGNHIEDTYNCPIVKSVRCFKAVRGYAGEAPAQFLAIYEFEGDDAEAAERKLAEYQADPDGWAGRLPGNDSMGVVGAGWYEEELSFGL